MKGHFMKYFLIVSLFLLQPFALDASNASISSPIAQALGKEASGAKLELREIRALIMSKDRLYAKAEQPKPADTAKEKHDKETKNEKFESTMSCVDFFALKEKKYPMTKERAKSIGLPTSNLNFTLNQLIGKVVVKPL